MAILLYRYDTWVKAATGPAISGAQVWVCNQPANTAATPPSPLASIFADSGGLVPISQPLLTDGFGHADFYAEPGLYTAVISLGGTIQQVYPDQSIGNVGTIGGGGGGTSGALTLYTNGAENPVQSVLNLYSSDGSVVLTPDNSGDVNFQVKVGASETALPAYFGNWEGTTYPLLPTTQGQFTCTTANTVMVWMFRLNFPQTFNHIVIGWGPCNTSTCAFGIYSSSGNLLISWDGIAAGYNSFTKVTPSQGSTVLEPGYYFWACACSINHSSGTVQTGAGLNNGESEESSEIWNYSTVRGGYATNLMSGGNLPNTLGTLTAGFPNSNGALPAWIVEP